MTENRNRRSSLRFSDVVRLTEDVLNPRITCGSSRSTDEQHAPAELSDPFIKSLDTEGVLCHDGFVSGDDKRLDP